MVLTVCCQCHFMWNLLLLVAQHCSQTVVLKGVCVCAVCKGVQQKKKERMEGGGVDCYSKTNVFN